MRNSRFGAFLFCLAVVIAGTSTSCLGQSADAAPQMAGGLRADGKIWVVVLVLATIFAGLLAWLIRTDRRIARLEKDRRNS
jgi:hypothetical protein